jgi:hypothetical protein
MMPISAATMTAAAAVATATMSDRLAGAVRDNPALSRFELDAGGATAILNYRLDHGVMALNHTETPPQARGQGIASRLVAGVLETARTRGLKVVPRCPFVRDYLAKHPEFSDLVAS